MASLTESQCFCCPLLLWYQLKNICISIFPLFRIHFRFTIFQYRRMADGDGWSSCPPSCAISSSTGLPTLSVYFYRNLSFTLTRVKVLYRGLALYWPVFTWVAVHLSAPSPTNSDAGQHAFWAVLWQWPPSPCPHFPIQSPWWWSLTVSWVVSVSASFTCQLLYRSAIILKKDAHWQRALPSAVPVSAPSSLLLWRHFFLRHTTGRELISSWLVSSSTVP